MKKYFSRLVRIGVFPDTPEDLVDEIKVINSIKIQGAVMVWLTGILTLIAMPRHAPFIIGLLLVHLVVAVAVVRMNGVKRYNLAKWFFVMDPAILVLALTAYFSIDSNFHFIVLICFLMFIYLFRKRTSETFSMLSTFMTVSLIGIVFIYILDLNISEPSSEEIQQLRLAVYCLSAALSIMMGLVLRINARTRSALTQATLQVSERDAGILQTISDNMDEAIFRSHQTKGLEYVNQAFVRFYGYDSKEEVMSTHPVNLYHSKSDRDALMSQIEQYGKVTNKLLFYRRKDGSNFWGRLSSTQMMDGDDMYLVGTITDVTQQQEQTELLREIEQQLREAQRLAKVGNWRATPAQNQVDWSGECATIHGFLPTDHEDAFDVWVEGLKDQTVSNMSQGIVRAAQLNRPYEFGSWYTTPDGETKYLYYICRSVESDGDIDWYGTVQDRTIQKNQELELLSTREFYQDVLDNIPVEVVLMENQGKYVYISKNASADDELRHWLIGRINVDYAEYRGLDPAFAQNRDDRVSEALKGELTVRWEEKMQTKDGRDSYHIRNLVPVRLREGRVEKKFLIGYSFDINDIKRAQFRLQDRNDELNQLNKELDRFVYSISHDLRAPIASVLGLNSLADEAEDQDELENILNMQREALDRLDRYIRDVIDYSRNKRLDVRAENVHVEDVIDECWNDLIYMADYDDIDYYKEIEEGLTIHTDALRVRIIINNLLSNALKYADPKKEKRFIAVRAKRDNGGMLFEIEDNGLGIKEEFKEQIWDIFFRGTSTIPGSGLGLYILRESAKNIGGEVKFDSKEGKGTTFSVHLPELAKED